MMDDDDDELAIVHSITVAELRGLLSRLKDDDVLYPNRVRNLLIVRDGASIGFLDLLEGHPGVEFWGRDAEAME